MEYGRRLLLAGLLLGVVLVVGGGLWLWLRPQPQPRYVGRSWEEERALSLVEKGEKGGVYTDREFDDLVKIATRAKHPYIQAYALTAFWFVKRPEQRARALQIATELLQKQPHMRWEAIMCIGRIGDEGHIPMIKPYLADPDPQVRSVTVFAVARLGGSKYRSLIEPLANDASQEVRDQVYRELAQWSSQGGRDDALSEGVYANRDFDCDCNHCIAPDAVVTCIMECSGGGSFASVPEQFVPTGQSLSALSAGLWRSLSACV